MSSRFDSYKTILIKTIGEILPNAKIYLFGSRARRTNKPESDIDIALDAGGKIELGALGRLREAIEELPIPLFIDLVDLHANISDDFRSEITREGIEWK